MNKAFTLLFLLTLTSSSLFAKNDIVLQIRKAHEHYRNNNFDSSMIYFDSVALSSPFYFKNTFGLLLKWSDEGDKKAVDFVHQYANKGLPSSPIIKPVSIYLSVKSTKRINPNLADSLNNLLLSSIDTTMYAGMYNTSSFLLIDKSTTLSTEQKQSWIANLQKQNQNTTTYRIGDLISAKKYLNTFYAYYKYQNGFGSAIEVFSDTFSFEEIRQINGFFPLRQPKSRFPSVEKMRKPVLNEHAKNDEKYLNYAVSLVNSYPTSKNIKWLKKLYGDNPDFNAFWQTQSQANWKDFPLDSVARPYIDSLGANKWVILDIWGTWCGPCRRELPGLAEMDNKQRELPNQPIVFLTLSYSSKDLDVFMDTNSYSFPVIEIKKTTCQELGVNSYPTTFLISSNRKYMILPFNTNKEEIAKIYSLLEW